MTPEQSKHLQAAAVSSSQGPAVPEENVTSKIPLIAMPKVDKQAKKKIKRQLKQAKHASMSDAMQSDVGSISGNSASLVNHPAHGDQSAEARGGNPVRR